jgi:NADH-quinone oxidoreductase subunit J
MSRSLLRAAIALALASALVAVLMFRLNASLAAVFELSVCSGLISVLFISTISLTSHETSEEKTTHLKRRLRRFWFLPVILVALGAVLAFMQVRLAAPLLAPETVTDPRVILWNARPLDLLGQIVIMLGGVFGVVLLFKEQEKK